MTALKNMKALWISSTQVRNRLECQPSCHHAMLSTCTLCISGSRYVQYLWYLYACTVLSVFVRLCHTYDTCTYVQCLLYSYVHKYSIHGTCTSVYTHTYVQCLLHLHVCTVLMVRMYVCTALYVIVHSRSRSSSCRRRQTPKGRGS